MEDTSMKVGQSVVHTGDFAGRKGKIVEIRPAGDLPVLAKVEWDDGGVAFVAASLLAEATT